MYAYRSDPIFIIDDQGVGGALLHELAVPASVLPRGKWRLGVPCSHTKVVLLRFAHRELHDLLQQKTALYKGQWKV